MSAHRLKGKYVTANSLLGQLHKSSAALQGLPQTTRNYHNTPELRRLHEKAVSNQLRTLDTQRPLLIVNDRYNYQDTKQIPVSDNNRNRVR